MEKPTISQYLIANCLSIIDEFNIFYRDYDKTKLKKEADEKFNEMDITVRIGYPFKQTAHYTVGESVKTKKDKKINHDLYIQEKDFKIEVKYLKNWKTPSNTWSASKTWSVFQQDFDWLTDEINAGNKGKVAFVIGWFNCVKSLSQLIQLGTGNGAHPFASESKLAYFPFLIRSEIPTRTSNLEYGYDEFAYSEMTLNLISSKRVTCNCMFLGNEHDCFHFALYY